ncbi:MAG: hypothetical protein WCL11_24435, partial [Verrucomicrobiota bacterium]
MKSIRVPGLLAGAVLAVMTATTGRAEPAVVSDPNFPLIQLPADFDSHRTTKRVNLAQGQECRL